MTPDNLGGFGRKCPEKIRRPPRWRRTGQVGVRCLSGELHYLVELRAHISKTAKCSHRRRAVVKRHATHIAFPAPARKQMSAHCAPTGSKAHSQFRRRRKRRSPRAAPVRGWRTALERIQMAPGASHVMCQVLTPTTLAELRERICPFPNAR